LDMCLHDAIDASERGYAVSPMTAGAWDGSSARSTSWAAATVPAELSPAPRAGERVCLPDLGRTLRLLADEGASGFYSGEVAEAICAVSWLEESDLVGYEATWTDPLRASYRDVEVAELPPPTQGVAALEALALLDRLEPTLSNQIRCAGL